MKPGPKPLLGSTMSHAQRQARYRDGHADGAPKLRYRKSEVAPHHRGQMAMPADRSAGVMPWPN